jgi:hypothetical protein
MDCERVQDSLSDYLEGALPEGEAEAVARHLAACPPCDSVRAELARILAGLAALPPIAAPPELLGRVTAEIAALSAADGADRAKSSPSPWKIPLQAAAALLLVALGYGIGTGVFRGGSAPSSPIPPVTVAAVPRGAATDPAAPAAPERSVRPDGANLRQRGKSSPGGAGGVGKDGAPAAEGAAAGLLPRPAGMATMEIPRRLPQELPETAHVSTGREPLPSSLVPHPDLVREATPREVILFIPVSTRREAVERVVAAAGRCAGLPAGGPVPRVASPEQVQALRVTLPRPQAVRFVSELRSIGSVAPAFSLPPRAEEEGDDVAFTVRLVER